MRKLIVELPADRNRAGVLRLEDENGCLVAGPFDVCGLAHEGTASLNGNPTCDLLLPYGNTTVGHYRVIAVCSSGPNTEWPARQFGEHGVIVLAPTAGDAALADANGRFRFLIHGDAAASWTAAADQRRAAARES